jgi:putative acetyltransferase
VIVRPETDNDRPRILDVVEAAFGKKAERVLVERLYADARVYRPGLSLVAETPEDGIVGHVLVTTAWLDEIGGREIASLAPLAVAPEHQRTGVGTALVHAVCAVCDDRGEPLVVLQGHPNYYPRMGFEVSAPIGITFDLPDWAAPEAAMVRRLSNYDASLRGHVIYPEAFDGLPE